MAGKVRLAATQTGFHHTPSEADPFGDGFRMEAARRHARERIDFYASQVEQAGRRGADLVVTQEDVANLDRALVYLDDRSIFRTLVEETSDYVVKRFSDVARRLATNVVVGFYEPARDKIFNTALLIARDGTPIGRYRKVHLPPDEAWLVTPGDSFPAFETDIGMVGMIVCFDDLWAESMLSCSLNGARIICHPMACASPPEWRMRTRAWEAQVVYITSGYAGSSIVAPSAEMMASAGDDDPGIVTAEVDLSRAFLASEDTWDYVYSGIADNRERRLKMRHPEAYGVLAESSPPALKQCPERALPATPDAIRAVYEKQKDEFLRILRGQKGRYQW